MISHFKNLNFHIFLKKKKRSAKLDQHFFLATGKRSRVTLPPGGRGTCPVGNSPNRPRLFHWPVEIFYDTWHNSFLQFPLRLQMLQLFSYTDRSSPCTAVPKRSLITSNWHTDHNKNTSLFKRSCFYLSRNLQKLPLLLKTKTDVDMPKCNFILINKYPGGERDVFFPDQKKNCFLS